MALRVLPYLGTVTMQEEFNKHLPLHIRFYDLPEFICTVAEVLKEFFKDFTFQVCNMQRDVLQGERGKVTDVKLCSFLGFFRGFS